VLVELVKAIEKSFPFFHPNGPVLAGGVVVMESSSQAEALTQTKHSTAGENPVGNPQGGKLHWLPISTF
jgi:hypothetical protein